MQLRQRQLIMDKKHKGTSTSGQQVVEGRLSHTALSPIPASSITSEVAWVSYRTSLCLIFLTCKVGKLKVPIPQVVLSIK